MRFYDFFEKYYIFLFFLFGSGFLLLTDNKAAGVPFLRETFIFITLIASLVVLAKYPVFLSNPISLFVVFYVSMFFFLSPLLAYFYNGQPIYYGMFEERRILFFMSYFIVLYLLIVREFSIDSLVRLCIYGFVLSSIVGWLYRFNIVPDNAAVDFAVDFRDKTVSNDVRADTRYRIAGEVLLFVFSYSCVVFKRSIERDKFFGVLILYIASYVWFVDQTRMLMASMALIFTMIFWKDFSLILFRYIYVFVAVLIICAVNYSFVEDQFSKFLVLFEPVGRGAYEISVRDETKSIILDSLSNSCFFGCGALSLQYLDGFHGIFNGNFYLSDVGLYGIVFRFGVISLPIILLIYYFLFAASLKFRDDVVVKAFVYSFLPALIFFDKHPFMVMSGFSISLYLAYIAYLRSRFISEI